MFSIQVQKHLKSTQINSDHIGNQINFFFRVTKIMDEVKTTTF